MKPLAIDLYCGLGGWAEGFLSEGYEVIGFDIERHDYGTGGYPGELRIADVRSLHGSQFKDATVIVASPPCQKYSYMAMPWSRAKKMAEIIRKHHRENELNELFNACFRIQREASQAAGRYIPLIVENVRGAQTWVGRAQWHYGSYYLWGDVPALMPFSGKFHKNGTGGSWFAIDGSYNVGTANDPRSHKIALYSDPRRNGGKGAHLTSQRENLQRACICPASCDCESPELVNGVALVSEHCPVHNYRARFVEDCPVHDKSLKVPGITFSGHGEPGYKAQGFNVTAAQRYREDQAVKCGGAWFVKGNNYSLMRQYNSRSNSRKAASAHIAKIPFTLAQYIARYFKNSTSGETEVCGQVTPKSDGRGKESIDPKHAGLLTDLEETKT